jgi:alpha-mannosidase
MPAMLRSDRRTFLAWLAALPVWRGFGRRAAQQPTIEARPTALYQQPDGRKNLVRIAVAGLGAPAARARVTDRRGALVGTAGLLPLGAGLTLTGEVWVPLSQPVDYQVDVEVGRERAARSRVRLTPPKRWTVYCLSSIHTDVGYTDVQENALEIHRKNLDAAVARLPAHPDYRFTPECALQVLSYLENRAPEAGDALLQAIRDGKVGFQALFANLLTGLLDHETLARAVWPAGRLARERGLTYAAAQITDVPGQTATFPMVLAASGVKYLASGANPERAVPLLPQAQADQLGLLGSGTSYPQVYYWEGPDGSRVLHWRAHHYGDEVRYGFAAGPDEMGRRLSDWLLSHPVFLSRDWPYDLALLYGADWQDNAPMREQLVANLEEFNRRYAFPRLVPGRAEDFFRELERRHGPRIPVRRGDTGLYWEDGAASTAAELATFRAAQLAARAAEIMTLWDARLEPHDDDALRRLRRRAADRAAMWRDLLLFGEHTWGADVSVSSPDAPQTVVQWAYKKRFVDGAAAAARQHVADGLLRLGRGTAAGRGRIVFNAGCWERTDVARVAGGAGKAFASGGHDLPAVDLEGGDALVLVRDVPPLGYLTLTEADRAAQPPVPDGDAVDARAGGFALQLDPATGAIRSLTGPDNKERVKPSDWSGLNQLVYVRGGERSALWTTWDRNDLKNPPQLEITQARLVRARRERLPGIGVRLVAERALAGFPAIVSTVTLYDDLPWVDLETRLVKTPTLAKEALYVAFPFAFTQPTVEVEVPLGRTTVERDQQPGSCRDWYCHTHWVWLREGNDGVLWSGPDTPLFTLNDLCRGAWRRAIVPDGTLFAYAMNNYWHTNYAARQGGEATFRFRLSLLGPGDVAEPVRRGWAACDPLYVSPPFENGAPGPLISKDRALFLADKGVLVVGAKPADDGDGAVVKLLDVAGQTRSVGVWPAAYAFRLARRANLVEMNGDAVPVGGDGKAAVDLPAWGVAGVRLFTPAERTG